MCTVELDSLIEVSGNSANFSFRGVGSEITGFACRLDGAQLLNCRLFYYCHKEAYAQYCNYNAVHCNTVMRATCSLSFNHTR